MEKLSVGNGDAAVKSSPRKSRRKSKPEPSTQADIRSSNMSEEERSLATHVEICAIRYKGIQEKFDGVERRLDKVEADISAIKTQMQTGFSEIKLLLEQRNTSKQVQIIASAATVIAAILAAFGYWLVKH